jgi:acyl carrier protein
MSLDSVEIQKLVTDVLVDTMGLDPAEIVPEADLEHDLGLDSLERLELVTAIEGEIGATVPDLDVTSVRTVADAVALVERFTLVQGAA